MKKNKYKLQPIVLLVLAAWVVAIFAFSSETYQQQTIIPLLKRLWTEEQIVAGIPDWHIAYHGYLYSAHRDPYHFIEFIFRKLSHLFMYGMLGMLVFVLLRGLVRPLFVRALLTAGAVAALAYADEWNQSRSAGRVSTLNDVVIDVTGALMGIIVVSGASLLFNRSHRQSPAKIKNQKHAK